MGTCFMCGTEAETVPVFHEKCRGEHQLCMHCKESASQGVMDMRCSSSPSEDTRQV